MMRESLARGVTVATTLALVGAVGAFALLQQRGPDAQARPAAVGAPERLDPVPDALAALIARGKEVYDEVRCAVCHSIAGEGSPRYPLDGVGSRLTAEEIRLWIVDPQEARPGVRKPAYDDLEPEELQGLIAYMGSLKEPGGSGR
jgi:mono/diheme cytochrome c family protein